MFKLQTKLLAALFTICFSGTILSAIEDIDAVDATDSEDALCRIREDEDPKYYAKYKKNTYDRIRQFGEITEEDIAEVEKEMAEAEATAKKK